eukprot:4288775-Lingulodinium_polyedra.AAC.1
MCKFGPVCFKHTHLSTFLLPVAIPCVAGRRRTSQERRRTSQGVAGETAAGRRRTSQDVAGRRRDAAMPFLVMFLPDLCKHALNWSKNGMPA